MTFLSLSLFRSFFKFPPKRRGCVLEGAAGAETFLPPFRDPRGAFRFLKLVSPVDSCLRFGLRRVPTHSSTCPAARSEHSPSSSRPDTSLPQSQKPNGTLDENRTLARARWYSGERKTWRNKIKEHTRISVVSGPIRTLGGVLELPRTALCRASRRSSSSDNESHPRSKFHSCEFSTSLVGTLC